MTVPNLNDDQVELQDRPFDFVPLGSTLRVTTTSKDKTLFVDATIQGHGHDGKPLGQEAVLDKTFPVAIASGTAYVARVTVVFSGDVDATVTVDGTIVDHLGNTLGKAEPVSLAGRRPKVARARFRVAVLV